MLPGISEFTVISSVCDCVHRSMYTAYCDVQAAAGLNVTQ